MRVMFRSKTKKDIVKQNISILWDTLETDRDNTDNVVIVAYARTNNNEAVQIRGTAKFIELDVGYESFRKELNLLTRPSLTQIIKHIQLDEFSDKVNVTMV